MLSLVADYETTSSSSSEEDDTDNENAKEKQSKSSSPDKTSSTPLLPSANLLLCGGSTKPAGEVLSNPFFEAEKLKIDKLQKHVKMVDSENHIVQKNGRKICWNNRKGRCRFGNKCKYAHDSDLVEAKQDINASIVNKELVTTAVNKHSHKEADFSSESSEKLKTRKRPGLGDSSVPGKRVMKTYHSAKRSS